MSLRSLRSLGTTNGTRSANGAHAQPLRNRLRAATATAILEAAEEVAAETGVTGASLQAIADRAGVAVGTIYNHFEDREELFRELFARRRDDLIAALDVAHKASLKAPFRVQLTALVRAFFDHVDTHRQYMKIALETEHMRAQIAVDEDGQRRHVLQQVHENMTRVAKLGIKEGVLRAEDAKLYAGIIAGVIKGVVMVRLDDPSPLARHVDTVVDIFLHGAAK